MNIKMPQLEVSPCKVSQMCVVDACLVTLMIFDCHQYHLYQLIKKKYVYDARLCHGTAEGPPPASWGPGLSAKGPKAEPPAPPWATAAAAVGPEGEGGDV